MKFMHLADLHLGKRVNGFSMLEDQRYILAKIQEIAKEQRPEAVLIAGDVYDRSVPSEEAVDLFDDFLVQLARQGIHVYVISGNHDSAERVAFGGRLMDASGIHLAPVYEGTITPYVWEDDFGPVRIYPIPFLKPAHVRRYFPEEEIVTYTDAMRVVIEHLPLDASVRNVALVHQFVTGAAICDSEEHSVGGLDEVEGSVFEPFDYVALGHLHGPQRVGREILRYAGSPLKYSFSEVNQKKSVTIVNLKEKGNIQITTVPLCPQRDWKKLKGTFAELTDAKRASEGSREDYYEITLTDEEDIPEAMARLRVCYPNLMLLGYDNTRTRSQSEILGSEGNERKSPLELFDELYELQNGQPMSEEQRDYARALIEEIWEEEL